MVIACCVVLLAIPAWADEPRHQIHFESQNGRYVLLNLYRSIERVPVFEDGRFVGVMDQKREEDLWGLFDARSAVMLEPANVAQTLAAGRAPEYILRADLRAKTALVSDDGFYIIAIDDFSEHQPTPDLPVLHFYSSGTLLAKYRLESLLTDVENIRYTSSHFRWFFSRSLKFDREELSLTTTECVPLVFSTKSGEMTAIGERSPGDC